MENIEEKAPKYKRPENLLKALGIPHESPGPEEREMQKLLLEEYKKKGKKLVEELKRWREDNPKASLGEAIRSLYKEIEEER